MAAAPTATAPYLGRSRATGNCPSGRTHGQAASIDSRPETTWLFRSPLSNSTKYCCSRGLERTARPESEVVRPDKEARRDVERVLPGSAGATHREHAACSPHCSETPSRLLPCLLPSLLLHRDWMLKRTTLGPASSARCPFWPTPPSPARANDPGTIASVLGSAERHAAKASEGPQIKPSHEPSWACLGKQSLPPPFPSSHESSARSVSVPTPSILDDWPRPVACFEASLAPSVLPLRLPLPASRQSCRSCPPRYPPARQSSRNAAAGAGRGRRGAACRA